MKIDYVIVSSNNNPYYLDFWPIVSKVWKKKFNITPVLGLIGDENSDFEESEYGLVKKFKSVEGIDTGLQSQIVRLFLPKDLNGYCLISDIDIIPLSVKYFEECASHLTDTNIVVYSSDHPECLKNNEYPMCYVSSHSESFKNILQLDTNWDSFVNLMKHRNQGWATDQKYLFEKVNQFKEKTNDVVLLNRGWSGIADKRIDRASWSYDSIKVSEGYYIDSHSLRPYPQYSEEINKLVNLIKE
jgi:hypothetical protein